MTIINDLKICFIARRDFESKPGGDTVQWQMYEKTARNAGCGTVTWFDDRPLPEADVYHAFNIDRPLELYPKLRIVKNSEKPFIISTIHHPNAWMKRFRSEHPPSGIFGWMLYRTVLGSSVPRSETVKEVVRLVQQGRFCKCYHLFPSWSSRVNWILKEADRILLLSWKEAQYLKVDFGYVPVAHKAVLLPNWVEGIPVTKVDSPNLHDFAEAPVIVVGRVETRKNLLRIALIADQMSRPTLIVGRVNPNERQYASELKQIVDNSRFVRWNPGVPREQMADYYRSACFLLNASYAEVSPLVDIEALSFGCPVATTRYALHHEFLPEHTPLCDAYSHKSLSELLNWRPSRLQNTFVVDGDKCKKNLISTYCQLFKQKAA